MKARLKCKKIQTARTKPKPEFPDIDTQQFPKSQEAVNAEKVSAE